jgi:hypothetical protein
MASSITGLVLEKKDIQFVNTDGTVGAIMAIPTPDGNAYIDGNYWAVPINDGVYAGWNYQPYNPTNAVESVKPTPFSVAVVRISENNGSDWFYVLGTSAQYITASNGGTALPTTWTPSSHGLPLLPACQVINSQNDNGNYVAVLGVPSLAAGYHYFPYGYLNGTQLTAATANGYADLTSLLAFLNSGTWANVGTWTKTSDNLTLVATQTSGSGTDVLCAALIAINPSA